MTIPTLLVIAAACLTLAAGFMGTRQLQTAISAQLALQEQAKAHAAKDAEVGRVLVEIRALMVRRADQWTASMPQEGGP